MEIDKRFVLRKDIEEMDGREKMFHNYVHSVEFNSNSDYNPLFDNPVDFCSGL